MSKLGSRAFFSFSRLRDDTKHRAYGEWHGLDHMPENLALDGVALGTRWVRTPECRAATATASAELDPVQYLTMYWFRDPWQESIAGWEALASRSRHWGRRPELEWTERVRRGFHVPIQGHVDPGALVGADVLPFRPTTGIHLTVSTFTGPPVDVVDALAWYDQVRIPDLVAAPGAAGAWSFVTEESFEQDRRATEMTSVRVLITYLDGDPVAFARSLPELEASWRERGRDHDVGAVEEVLLATPLVAVVPYTWDWFDGATGS